MMGEQAIDGQWIRGGCVAAAIFMAIILFAGAKTAAEVPLFPPPWDKLAHFTYYGIMAGLLTHGLGARWWIVPLLLVPLTGGLDEWHQSTVPGRDASVWDWVADVAGAMAATVAYRKWGGRRER